MAVAALVLLLAADARELGIRPAGAVRLVANEYGHGMSGASWVATSGSLFTSGDAFWSGRPDVRRPGASSAFGTNSAVLRVVGREPVAANVVVSLDVRPVALVSGAGHPRRAFDGVHLLVRYRSPSETYVVSLIRRDGQVVVKKKVPGGPSYGGTYVTLGAHRMGSGSGGRAAGGPARWRRAEVSTTDVLGGVRIRLRMDGKTRLDVVDRGLGGPALSGPGRIGVRGDNCDFYVRALTVRPLGDRAFSKGETG
ncbi:hypothetical protein [Cryptosporangium minutisporangium]|uniref:DUF1080 domain-containing protein n=1 Tax=Cryptosporangium minutisporangium TaxID=113569 RepID=A0ABP6SUR6_9ACTN